MSTATATLQEYRVTVRHTPFRTKSRVVKADTPAQAWAAFLELLRDEHRKLTVPQQKSFGRQQAEWLEERSRHPGELPPHTSILPEAEHQTRIRAAQERELQAQKAVERQQQLIAGMAESQAASSVQVATLLAQLPGALAEAVKAALEAKPRPAK